MQRIELLAPAGDLERLKTAFIYGADAVYIGGEIFGMRSAAKNFNKEDMAEGVRFAHERGKQVFVTVNIIPRNEEFEQLEAYLKELEEIGVDAVIVSDPGVFSVVKKVVPNMEIHISTQASTTNAASATFWYNQGAKRVVMARELSFEEIKEIRDNSPEGMDIEAFIHGAMCMSYSGKCVISNYTTGRDANRGACAQSCRWKYTLVEEQENGDYEKVLDDVDAEFFFNTKDMCMINYIPQIIESGINSFKIEGRMKTAYYVATTVRAYRMAIDEYIKDPENWEFNPMWLEELKKGSHRHFSEGFYLGKTSTRDQNYESASYVRNYDFIGVVRGHEEESGLVIVEQRNRMFVGDEIEIIGPYKETMYGKILEMYNEENEPIESAPHAKQIVKMKLDIPVEEHYMLRKPITTINVL
ncbi:peptidase U32 family protein [Paraclostridium bifermentans]|uniref:Peptidase U32 family protein n=1 Tax=Paraclostridium bifermentans ATCC 638 = DSM 14991 TaxID=1233171 RepID=T4VPV2_PARBF|nr:U32 family peptidase [Paraclostridium bifermentans]EQK42702.1 peptidase U32 family protein [[Clostridium] bifermentans ATCC 638] [Paraclostridium bifermentans ATCC 638 = DSM 14991]MBS6508078.1 U32 family peptidase [Paraclostridium bifermentans]RIZ58388.1 peptidase U32 [Paraclostridium bifermentans]UAG19504.1 U32 family peptidase [Paraclostridium bifermentans]